MQVQKIQSNNYNTSFGLKNDKKIAHRVLQNVRPELKKDIFQEINAFCDLTQKRGITGLFRLDKIKKMKNKYGQKKPMLVYSIKPTQTNKVEKYTISLYGVTVDSLLSQSVIGKLDYSKKFAHEDCIIRQKEYEAWRQESERRDRRRK